MSPRYEAVLSAPLSGLLQEKLALTLRAQGLRPLLEFRDPQGRGVAQFQWRDTILSLSVEDQPEDREKIAIETEEADLLPLILAAVRDAAQEVLVPFLAALSPLDRPTAEKKVRLGLAALLDEVLPLPENMGS